MARENRGLGAGQSGIKASELAADAPTSFVLSQQSLEKVVADLPAMVYQFRMDADGTMSFPFVSQYAYGLYDITPEDFREDPAIPLKRVHPDCQAEVQALIRESATRLNIFSWKGKIVTKKGVEKWIHARSVPERQADGAVLWTGIVIDHSHEKKLEEEVQKQRAIAEHQAKLASIGQLASGIGHEINNPLMILAGKMERVRQLVSERKQWDPGLQTIFESHGAAAYRIKKIVDGLGTFSRMEDEITSEVCNLGELIRSTYFMISEILESDGIVFQFDDFSGEGIFGNFPAGKLQQILLNLISNARDAMANQTRKILRVELAPLSDTAVRIQVEDSGEGIQEELWEKVFDPFFTTKDVGKGTGLGLSLSQSIAKRLGGSLDLIRTGKTGTLFELRIPRAACPEDTQSRVSGFQQSATSRPKLHLSCLIVDDEPEIREILGDLLEQHVHGEILEASNGIEALDCLKGPKGKTIGLVLTDLSMPKMGGKKLVSEIRAHFGARAPQIYVVTGRVPEAGVDLVVDSGADGHLQKPFGGEAIVKMLRDLDLRRRTSTQT